MCPTIFMAGLRCTALRDAVLTHPAVDISAHGAKVRTKVRLKTGTAVRLEFVPPEGPPLRVGALVWRVDADGLAFLFARGIQHRFIRAA